MGDPTYIVRGDFVPSTWGEVNANYTWAQLASGFTWAELSAGPIPDKDILSFDTDLAVASIDERLKTGQGSVLLDNRIGEYSPEGGSKKPQINQVLTIKALTDAGSVYGLHSGFIKNIQVAPVEGRKTTKITAHDIAKDLTKKIFAPVAVNTKPSSLFWDVLSLSGIPEAQRQVDAMTDDIPFAWLNNISGGQALDDVMRSGAHHMFVDGFGTFHAKDRNQDIPFTIQTSFTNNFLALDYRLEDRLIFNDITVNAEPRKETTDVATVGWIDAPIFVAGSSQVTLSIEFLDPITEEKNTPANSIVSLVASQDYYITDLENGAGTDLTSGIGITLKPFATTAQITVANSNAVGGWVNRLQVRGLSLRLDPLIQANTQVASSQEFFGKKSLDFKNDLIDGFPFAESYSQFIADRRKDPLADVSFAVKNKFSQIFDIQPLNNITLVESNSGLSGEWQVLGIRHRVTLARGLEHVTTYEVTKTDVKSFFLLDIDRLDQGRLGF